MATVRDLVEGNIEKVFDKGYAADQEVDDPEAAAIVQQAQMPAPRPGFGVDAREVDAVKFMSMAGPFIPAWMRGQVGPCWAAIQLSKRWTRFNQRTNSWIHFDPITIAQASYLVENKSGEQTVAFMSVFIRALIDAFAPTKARLRYSWAGEGQDRTCTCSATLIGEVEPHSYTTPPLQQITPKRSPLWSSDPDRQLAYFASRAWGRLFCAGVLHGVYDEDELEGRLVAGPALIEPRAATAAATQSLYQRIEKARAAEPERGGFKPGIQVQWAKPLEAPAAAEPAGAKKRAGKGKVVTKPRKPITDGRRGRRKERNNPATSEAAATPTAPTPVVEVTGKTPDEVAAIVERDTRGTETPMPQSGVTAMPVAPEPPRDLVQYREHVRAWLMQYDTEESIEERWRSEMGLRNRCGLVSEEKAAIRADYVDPRIQALRQGK